MAELNSVSIEQLKNMLDNAPVAVYVSEVDSKKLLYANRLTESIAPDVKQPNAHCYTVAGFDAPCPFCRMEQMTQSELTVREYLCPSNQHIYQLSGKLLDWEGKHAHIEYIVDITDKKNEEERYRKNERDMKFTLGSIPCGLSVYQIDGEKIRPLFHNQAFYDITGYSREHIQSVEAETNYLNVHPDDLFRLRQKAEAVSRQGGLMQDVYRLYNDSKGEYQWIRLDGAVKTSENGEKYLYGVYTDISEQKRMEQELTETSEKMRETQMEMHHLVNSIPGGIASFQIEGERCTPQFVSDGVLELIGYTLEEFTQALQSNAIANIYEADRARVTEAVMDAMQKGNTLNVSYRVCHKDGSLPWIHMSARWIDSKPGCMRFYSVFTGMSEESRLFQSIADDTADGIYVIDRKNYDLLYANESRMLFSVNHPRSGQKCYFALHGRTEPCENCIIKSAPADGQEREFTVEGLKRVFSFRYKETVWNGIPAYVQYIRDVTEEANNRRERERLEQYFQNLIENLPGGIAVARCWQDGSTTPEYISEGFAELTKMTVEEAAELYKDSIFAGIHPDDVDAYKIQMQNYIAAGEGRCEFDVRLKRGDGDYVWTKGKASIQDASDGTRRLYCIYSDVSMAVEKNQQLRRRYEDLLIQHYHTPGPDELILGHCNITHNKILEIWGTIGCDLIKKYGDVRDEFFTGLSSLIVDEGERQMFLNTFLSAAALAAYARKETEHTQKCYIKLPQEENGRFVRIKMNMVETPDGNGVTGVLTVTDITKQEISDRILHQITVTNYDYVIDLDLSKNFYRMVSCNRESCLLPPPSGTHSERVAYMAANIVVPKDQKRYAQALEREEILRRLTREGSYTVSYSAMLESGNILTKNMTVSAVDLRLGRVCLVCTDITDSVREQQGLLNIMAYTFELMGILHLRSGKFTMYTRQSVLENLPPYVIENYGQKIQKFIGQYGTDESHEEIESQFRVETILHRLAEKPAGYEFVFPYRGEAGLRYKQVIVLWGDKNRSTVCMVRADVTDMLTAERNAKKTLEDALAVAKEASRAKSDFLTSMSHDIRTPMNAIMGMTTLALAYLDDRDKVESCLQKISAANHHLLSLINDVLDMSRIEQSQIAINRREVSLHQLIGQISAIMNTQAKKGGLNFEIREKGIEHPYFYGDSLRINQILINLLSNAIKFTPEGGQVEMQVEEFAPQLDENNVRYQFTVRDTGIGMSEEFLHRLFDPFARDASVMRVEGTGLGLSIVKALVDLMDGQISVESQPDAGTVFRVSLEFERADNKIGFDKENADSSVNSSNYREEHPFAGYTFLIAEDHPINAELLSELLKMCGGESVIAADGVQTLQAFQSAAPGTYDAILMDIQMPEMNGYEATRAIRKLERPDAQTIPIVAMTANAFAEDVSAVKEAGMNEHVAKPIDMTVLRATLTKVLKS